MKPIPIACVAEFLGVCALCFFGCGSVIVGLGKLPGATEAIAPTASLATVAFAHGLILFAFIAGCGYISGAHFNPAVTFGAVIAGKCDGQRAIAYVIAQLLGAACGAGLLMFLLTPEVANGPGPGGSAGPLLGATIGDLTKAGDVKAVVGLEAIATFALVFVVLTSAVDKRAGAFGPLAIGMTVTACILAIAPLTGASMNPARTFGPAICGDHWNMHWAYWAGPLGGAFLAATVYRVVWAGGQEQR